MERLLFSPSSFQRYTDENGRNLHWISGLDEELPIIVKTQGPGSEEPVTFTEVLHRTSKQYPNSPALRVKQNGQWITWTYKDYWADSKKFAKSLIALDVDCRKTVNIIGFNSPEWVIGFAGSMLGNCVPIGVYTTSDPEACFYIADHSEAVVIVVQNLQQLNKYTSNWGRYQNIKALVVYWPEPEISAYKGRFPVYTWQEFLALGKNTEKELFWSRVRQQTPNQCATVVYTSGTTGPPKGVMLSHDNYMWVAKSTAELAGMSGEDDHIVSYLPLSHVSAQVLDIFGPINFHSCLDFADENALKGTLGDTLRDVQPTVFLGVPRVYEKMEESIRAVAAQNSSLKQKIGDWAKSVGMEATNAQLKGEGTSLSYSLLKFFVYNKIKEALGMTRTKICISGAAPISRSTLDYFISLNIPIFNAYGMSECAGPCTINLPQNNSIYSAGAAIPGVDLQIFDKQGNSLPIGQKGEICFKGRHTFMGYLKNPEATIATKDKNGYVHSGDEGFIDENGFLFITGRFKELIVTSGGENIPPVLIENAIKDECKFLSQVFLVGEQRKYLTMLVTLKVNTDQDGYPTFDLSSDSLRILQEAGCDATTVQQAMQDQTVLRLIQEAMERVNDRAVSNAQKVQKFKILARDFTIQDGELTNTQKVKRSVVNEKYAKEIDELYTEPRI